MSRSLTWGGGRRRGRTLGAIVVMVASAPAVAHAHLVATGMGPIYDGISHFGLTPEDILPTVGLAAFAGLRGAAPARAAALALPLAWLTGGVLALFGASAPQLPSQAVTAGLFLVIGGLLAADAKLNSAALAALAAAVGIVRGSADLVGVSMSLPHVGALAGMTATAFAVFALAASLTLPLRRAWMIIAARVAGSWLAASGLLLAGWLLRYGARAS